MTRLLGRCGGVLLVVVAVAALSSLARGEAPPAPAAPLRPVTDQYFGTEVVDNYRYMENLTDPQVQAWMKAQAEYTRQVLDALPGRATLLARIHELSNADIYRGGFVQRGQRLFYLVYEPEATLPKLYVRDGLHGPEKLLIDPAALGKGGSAHYALDFYMPSWDGRYLAYGLSIGGSEKSVLHVLEVNSGNVLPEAIDRTSNSVIAWRPDNRSFFYLRYLKPTPTTPASETEYNARTYLHQLGTHENGDGDAAVFGRGVSARLKVPEGQGTFIVVAPDSAYAIAVANHNMDDNPSTLYVAPLAKVTGGETPWRKVADVEDGITQFEPHGDKLYLLSQKGAPRFRVLAISAARPELDKPEILVPEGPAVLTRFAVAKEGLYLRIQDGPTSQLLQVPWNHGASHAVALPFEGTMGYPVTDPREPGALFRLQGWTRPPVVVHYDPLANVTTDTGLIPASRIDTSQLESREVFAVAHDGTRIPLSIIHRKGVVLDGSRPTVLQGYGSYGISLEPYFDPTAIAWVERGGVMAIAHMRGGGEYGEDWHRGGYKRTKLNTVFDFVACAQYLLDARYTAPRFLAGQGASAGGIPVGGALTWRPELFGVILDEVGMSDTLRFETEPNGPPNVSEFGSVKTEDGFHDLYAVSTYAHVRDGIPYPAVLFSTGANDPRVSPWQMAKMAARLQAATSSHRPVLLRVDYDAGHGVGSTITQYETELADSWSFALWQMGDPAFQPRPLP